jgi:hypothetical protein
MLFPHGLISQSNETKAFFLKSSKILLLARQKNEDATGTIHPQAKPAKPEQTPF